MLLKNLLLRLSFLTAAVLTLLSPMLFGASSTPNQARRAPAAPVLLSPVNGAQGIATSTTLSWKGQTGVTNYGVYFGIGTTTPLSYIGGTDGKTTTYSISGLTPGTTYSWYVEAANKGGTTASALYSFTTAALTSPVLLSPANAAQGIATTASLQWQPEAAATSYDVYFGAQPALAGNTPQSTYTVSGLAPGATYSWYVVAKNASASSPSAVWSFKTAPAPAVSAPSLSSPANGATGVATTAALAWQAAANATGYDVYLGPAGSLQRVAAGITGTSLFPSGLTAGTAYSWYVLAINGNASAQSATWSFTTTATTTSGIHPAMEYTAATEIMSAGGWPTATPAKTYPVPSTPPKLGGAGTYVVDTSIPTNTRILRVTDAADIATLGAFSNATFAVPALGDHNTWSTDNKHALYLDYDGGCWYLLTLDLAQFPNSGTIVSKQRLPVYDVMFSYTNPDYIYGRSGSVFQRYQISTGQITNLFDAATIPGWDATLAYQTYFALSGDDQWMCLLDGIQDDAQIVACYNQVTGARRLLNVANSTVDGQPIGTTYPAASIHGIDFGSGSGLFIMGARGATNTIWELNKPLSIIPEETVWTNNHSATGVNGIVRGHSPIASDSRGFVYKPFSDMNNTAAWYELDPAIPSPTNWDNENHMSWSNNDPANPDKAPVIIQTALKYAHSTAQWLDNEIFAMRMDGVQQQVWHFFHTYTRIATSGCPTYLTSPHPSRDGRWVLFNSDWSGTLGSGSSSCGARMDVFLAELK